MKKPDEPDRQSAGEDLEFPDWSGMVDSSKIVSVAAAFKWIEEYRKMFPEAYRRRQVEPPEKCIVEFIL
jgi:hypothetical protein